MIPFDLKGAARKFLARKHFQYTYNINGKFHFPLFNLVGNMPHQNFSMICKQRNELGDLR